LGDVGTTGHRQELTSTGVPTGIESAETFWSVFVVARLRNAHELGVGARAEN
jgi:hypothetical protein